MLKKGISLFMNTFDTDEETSDSDNSHVLYHSEEPLESNSNRKLIS